MRNSLLGAVLGLGSAALLSACHPVEGRHDFGRAWGGHGVWSHHSDDPVTVAATLDCPDRQGALARTAVAADGKSCQYHGDDEQDVTLSLVALNNQPVQSALNPIEGRLRAFAPSHSDHTMVNIDNDVDSDTSDHDNAKIDLPGLHIDARGNKADIDVLGAHIRADGDRADIRTDVGMKGTSIHAGPGGAVIRAGDVGKNAANLVFILAGDNPGPSGYRAVGYIARGPANGPIVVGEFKSRNSRQDGHDHDLERLIDLNVTASRNGA